MEFRIHAADVFDWSTPGATHSINERATPATRILIRDKQIPMSSEGSVRRKSSVRFSIDIERTDTSENAFGISATSEDGSACTPAGEAHEGTPSIDLGFLQPEARYRAIICPVGQGTRLKGFLCDNEDVRACLSTDPAAGDGAVAACEVKTPANGTVRCRLSLDLIDKEEAIKQCQYNIMYQVMPPAKGHPSIKSFVHYLDKSAAVSPSGSGAQEAVA